MTVNLDSWKDDFVKQRLKHWAVRYKHAWLFLYAFIYLPWFCYLEDTVTRNYRVIHTWMDDLIPFCEYFIIPYLIWFVYVGSTVMLFFFKNTQDFYRTCAYLFTGMSLSLLICTLVPNGTDMRPAVDPEKNLCSWLVSLIHKADTSTNIFPSIHVFNSIAVHISILRSQYLKDCRWIRPVSLVIAVSVCLSTVFLKQHSVVDVIGGMVLAYVLYPMIYGSRRLVYQRGRLVRKALG